MITIKTEKEIQVMREGGKILAEIMAELENKVEPGITTKHLDKVASGLVLKYGAKPSFKNYQGFPDTLCTSVNEELVHCLPSNRKLQQGDIVSLDLGIRYKGFHTDMAITIPVGKISPEAQRLIRITKKALKRGLRKVRPGNTFGDIGNTVQRYVEDQGYNVVRELCGHGIGKEVHQEPQVPNYGKRKSGPKLAEGMTFCIEPMVTAGDWHLKKAEDGYGFQTRDNSLCAHFEHTLAVTQNGCKILTGKVK
ncbi:type I methionyl aminopeptidase [Patescibacteria group bacterium]|nr:type I methionyl aminopeptidase [Patescibacteria group bacterium]